MAIAKVYVTIFFKIAAANIILAQEGNGRLYNDK